MPEIPSARDVVDVLRAYYGNHGYALVFAGSLLENIALVSFVWPGGVIVLLGAIYARLGELSIGLVILLAWLGSLAGTLINYTLGRCSAWLPLAGLAGGIAQALVRVPAARWIVARVWPEASGDEAAHLRGRFETGLAATVERLRRDGAAILIGSQVSGHTRNIVSVAAGAAQYPWPRFLAIQAAGTLASSLLIGLVGYLIGEGLDLIGEIAGRLNLGLIAILLILWIGRGHLLRLAGSLRRGSHSRG